MPKFSRILLNTVPSGLLCGLIKANSQIPIMLILTSVQRIQTQVVISVRDHWIYKSINSSFHLRSKNFFIFGNSKSVTSSSSPLNWSMFGFHPLVLYGLLCCQVSQLLLNNKSSEFDGFSIGYVQSITSELTDSQISFSSLVQTLFCHYSHFVTSKRQNFELVASQLVMSSQSPMNWQITKSHFLVW